MKLNFKTFGWGEVFAIVAIAFTLVTFVRGCNFEKNIEKLNFIEQANQYRPHIIFETSSHIAEMYMTIDSFYIQSEHYNVLQGSLNIKAILDLKNIGNVKANLQYFLCTDSLSPYEINRNLFFGSYVFDEIASNKFFNRTFEILPNETKSFTMEKSISLPNDTSFCLHITILYSNDLNNVFDSYHWFHYKYNAEKILKDDTKYYKGKKDYYDLNLIQLFDQNPTSKIYTFDEVEILKDVLGKDLLD